MATPSALRQLLTPRALAAVRPVRENWLAKQRSLGAGPPFIRLGTKILYDLPEFDAWLDGHRVDPGAGRREPAEGDGGQAAPAQLAQLAES